MDQKLKHTTLLKRLKINIGLLQIALSDSFKRTKPSENDSNKRKSNGWHNIPHNGRWTQK